MDSAARRAARIAALLGSAGLMAMAGTAQAQDAGSNASEVSTASEGYDIVVTAQRRSELSRDVPIAIVSLSSDQLDRADVQQLADVGKLAPGVRFRGSSNFLQPSIRGVSTSLIGSGVGSNVGIYVDGFYASTAAGSNFQLLNLENIQVLKGPQGTLFGRNTTGGAILVTTARPSSDPQATFEASYGRFNAQRYQGYATTGLTEGLAIDVEGLFSKGDGYFRDIVTRAKNTGAYQNWSVRTGLSFEPSDGVSFLLRYQHSDTDDPSFVQSNTLVSNGKPVSTAAAFGLPIATRAGEVAHSPTQPVSFTAKTDVVQLTSKFDLGFAELASYTQYRKEETQAFSDLDASPAPISYLNLPQSVSIFTQELLLTSKPGPALQWTVGAFMLHQTDSFPNSTLSINGGPFLLTAATGLKTRSYAAYADGTYQFGEKLFVTAGIRYTKERGVDAFRFSGPLTGNLGLTSYPTLDQNFVTPRLVIRYKPDENSSLYASVTRGTKAGIIDTNDSDVNTRVRPEKLTSYEAGYKYGDRRFSIDLSAYYYDYQDLQVSIPIGTALLVRNAANSRIYGAEAQLRYSFGGGFEITGGVAYNNAKYRRFPNSQVFTQCLDPVACGSGFGLFAISVSDSSGLRMQMAPEFTATFSPSYTVDLAGGELNLSANLYHTSSYYLDTSQRFRQPGYTTLDLRAQWTDPSDHFTLAVYGSNITGERFMTQGGPGNFGGNALWSPPATWGASARVHF
jgi:iron complex outermembrane recepter protein